MSRLIILFIISLSLSSCKKDELEGEYSILQGKWKWVGSTEYTKHYSYLIDSSWTTSQWIPSANSADEFYLEYERKGKVAIWKNEKEIKFYRLNTIRYEEDFQSTSLPNGVRIAMYLNFNNDKPMNCRLNQDTMYVYCNYLKLPLNNYPVLNEKSNLFFIHKFKRIN